MKIHQHLDLKIQFGFLICLALLLCLGQTYGDSATISFNWAQTVRVSQTTPTLQVNHNLLFVFFCINYFLGCC